MPDFGSQSNDAGKKSPSIPVITTHRGNKCVNRSSIVRMRGHTSANVYPGHPELMYTWIPNQFAIYSPFDPYLFLVLGFISFIAATLIPMSSEISLLSALACGLHSFPAGLAASAGNCPGCSLNYYLGLRGGHRLVLRMARHKSGRRSLRLIRKYGLFSLFFSWLPIIGDPLTILAGCLKLAPIRSGGIVIGTRILRYLVLAGLIQCPGFF